MRTSLIFPSKDFPGSTVTEAGLYLQAELQLGRFTLVPGVRYDRFALDANQNDPVFVASLAPEAADFSDAAVSPKVGVAAQVTDALTVHAQYSGGFRAPPYSVWREIPAPFKRRALAAGTAGGRVYALGGLTPQSGPVLTVDVLDPATGEWSAGPDLPAAGRLQGFGVAGASDRGRVFPSQANGRVYALRANGSGWDLAAILPNSRFMHRLVSFCGHVLALGGASRAGHLTSVDVVSAGAGTGASEAGDLPAKRGAIRWPGFRGGRATNVSHAARLPLSWSDEQVTWRSTTPGFGQSSPVIWDGTVFLTSLEGSMKETLFITALGLDDGVERWRRTFDAAERLEWNEYVSKGAPTPTVDGDRVYAFFDSGDLLALNHEGDTVWHRDLSAEFGTGERLWFFDDLRGNHVPSPTVTDDLVIVGGMAVAANLALRRGPIGALDAGDVAWQAGSASNFGSAFLYGDCVYWVNPAGAARCIAPESGEVRWTHRLPASTWATPLGHGDRVYFFTEKGVTEVLRASAEAPRVLATNHLSLDAPITGFAAVDDAIVIVIVIRAGHEVIRVGWPTD